MTNIPNFLLKKIYKKGSLRHIEEGIAFDLKNILGPGLITEIGFVKINDTIHNSSVIKIIKSGAETLCEAGAKSLKDGLNSFSADDISSESPLIVKLNEEITCVLKSGLKLQQGINNIIVELSSHGIGRVQVKLSDTF